MPTQSATQPMKLKGVPTTFPLIKLNDAEWALAETRRALLLQIHHARRVAITYPNLREIHTCSAIDLSRTLVTLDASLIGDLRDRVWAASSWEFRRVIQHRAQMDAAKQPLAA